MSYSLLKLVHISCVLLSGLGFGLRGVLMLTEAPQLQSRWARTLPHLIDTVLLTSAVALAIRLGQYPFTAAWLTAKLFALIAYIVLGSIALRRGRSKAQRALALLLAMLTFAYIVSVAVHHHPAGFFAP